MFFEIHFDMYPEIILFAVGGLFALLTLFFAVYLITSRRRSRLYAQVLRQETELFDALTATAALTQPKLLAADSSSASGQTADPQIEFSELAYDNPQNQPGETMGLSVKAAAGTRALLPTLSRPPGTFDPEVIAGAYTIEREVGGGAMSRTFVIRSKKLGNLWFLKFISNKDGKLANEEHILKLLNHASLPRIVDVFHREEGTYLIVTLVEGIPLNMLGDTKMQISQYILMDWFEQIAQALNYLHNMRPVPVFHLDLKPGNIMVTHDNRLVLVDFGISRRFGEDASGAVTATYAAPEQFGGRVPPKYANLINQRFGAFPPEAVRWQIDARTDIYSLGVVMFELATGQSPIRANMKALNNFVSRDIAAIIQRCLSTHPAGRYHSAAELLDELRKLKGTKITMARTLVLRRIAAIAAIFTLALSGGLFFLGYNVYAFENGAWIASRPDIVTVSLQQSATFSIERHLPDDRIIQMDTAQIIWDGDGDNIAHIDGGRVTGINIGETLIAGRHRNSEVSLAVRVVEPLRHMIEISQRYQAGRTVTIFAGDLNRDRVDGSLAEINFFSPESITAAADGTLYIADAGAIRRIEAGISQTVSISPGFIAVDMLRHHHTDLFVLTAPWQELDGSMAHAIGIVTNGNFQAIYTADAGQTAIEDFGLGFDFDQSRLFLILRNDGLGTVFLKSVSPENPDDIRIHTQLPEGAASMTIAADGAIYIGNTATGLIQVYIGGGALRNFAGVADDRGFIDGTSPRFYMPQRLEHHSGYLYIWDFNTLRRIPAQGGIAGGPTITLAGIAGPAYDPQPVAPSLPAEDIILPHGRLMDFTVTDNGIFITDHKRGILWHMDY
jgi:serine/threonine protein kinase